MHEHVEQWLASYHDGELDERHRQQVRLHLADCALCRQKLVELERLSAALTAQPLPGALETVDLWPGLAGVLPERPDRDAQSWFDPPGWLTPAGLLLGQALLHVTGLAGLVLSVVILLVGRSPIDWLATQVDILPGLPALPQTGLWSALPANAGQVIGLALPPLLLVLLSAVLAVLYLAWLAAWWQRRFEVQMRNGG